MIRATLFLLGAAIAADAVADGASTHFNRAKEVARSTLGIDFGPRMAYIPQQVLETGDAEHAIGSLCKLVAKALDTAKSEVDNFAIASVDDDAQMRLLECIDRALGNTQLPSLRLVFVGGRHRELAARAIVEAWGATFYFAPDPDRAGVQ